MRAIQIGMADAGSEYTETENFGTKMFVMSRSLVL